MKEYLVTIINEHVVNTPNSKKHLQDCGGVRCVIADENGNVVDEPLRLADGKPYNVRFYIMNR